MSRVGDRWDESTGTVSRGFDEWKLTEADIRLFLVLTLELSRSHFDEVWNRIAASPARGNGEEMRELFDREVGINTVEYEWMALSAALKDAVTAFEVYVETARAEVLRAHGTPPDLEESLSWKRHLQPFLTKTLGVAIPQAVVDVICLRQILTHARGDLRTEDDRRKYASGITWRFAELTEADVIRSLDELTTFVRNVDREVWAHSWGRQRIESLTVPVVDKAPRLLMSSRLLFVCAGNTCRSPIAAALAASVLPRAAVESAGLMPGRGVAENAVSVVKEMTGVDISGHRARDVADVDLTEFDRVIALDRMVAEELAPIVPSDLTLVVWAVGDPYGGSLDDYRQCAEVLRAYIDGLAKGDDEGIAQLRADVERWRGRLSKAEPTYCQGVANKAAKHFEALVKRLAEQRVAATGCDLGALLLEVNYKGGARTIDKLPLGAVIQLVLQLTKYDTELAEACPSETRKALTMIVELRNETTHELAPQEMRAATDSLLDLIEDLLGRDTFVAVLARMGGLSEAGHCGAVDNPTGRQKGQRADAEELEE